MCLAIPGKVIKKDDSIGEVEILGVVRQISFDLCPDAEVNDFVLVHAGFAIQVIDEKEAEETIALLKELDSHGEDY